MLERLRYVQFIYYNVNGSISLKTTILHQFSGHGNNIVVTFDYHIPRFYALFEYDLHVASGAPNENIVQNHLNIALFNLF